MGEMRKLLNDVLPTSRASSSTGRLTCKMLGYAIKTSIYQTCKVTNLLRERI